MPRSSATPELLPVPPDVGNERRPGIDGTIASYYEALNPGEATDVEIDDALGLLDCGIETLRHRILDLSHHLRTMRKQMLAIREHESQIQECIRPLLETMDTSAADRLRNSMTSLQQHRDEQGKFHNAVELTIKALIDDSLYPRQSLNRFDTSHPVGAKQYIHPTGSRRNKENQIPDSISTIGYEDVEPILSPMALAHLSLNRDYTLELEHLEYLQQAHHTLLQSIHVRTDSSEWPNPSTSYSRGQNEGEIELARLEVEIDRAEKAIKAFERELSKLSFESRRFDERGIDSASTSDALDPIHDSQWEIETLETSSDNDHPKAIIFPLDDTIAIPTVFTKWSMHEGEDTGTVFYINSWLLHNLRWSPREQKKYLSYVDAMTYSLDSAELGKSIVDHWSYYEHPYEESRSAERQVPSKVKSSQTTVENTAKNVAVSASYRALNM